MYKNAISINVEETEKAILDQGPNSDQFQNLTD